MIKVNNKMFDDFLEIMGNYNEFLFGTKKELKKQLEICLNSQGYWSGNYIRLYYDTNEKRFTIEKRWQ